jgi:hypothetical protein
MAAKELKLNIQTENTVQIDDDTFITKVKIANVLAIESYDREAREFTGKPANTKGLAIQNAYQTVLEYLENKNMLQLQT